MLASEAQLSGHVAHSSLICSMSLQDGDTCLLMAAARGHVDAARLLIAAGADVNARDKVRG